MKLKFTLLGAFTLLFSFSSFAGSITNKSNNHQIEFRFDGNWLDAIYIIDGIDVDRNSKITHLYNIKKLPKGLRRVADDQSKSVFAHSRNCISGNHCTHRKVLGVIPMALLDTALLPGTASIELFEDIEGWRDVVVIKRAVELARDNKVSNSRFNRVLRILGF